MTSVVTGRVSETAAPNEAGLNGSQTNGPVTEGEQTPDVIPVDVAINNVVCSFSTKCHLNLKRIAMEGSNVEYHRQHGVRSLIADRPPDKHV